MRKSELSRPWQVLIEWCQQLNYGRVENLVFVGGQPSVDPAPRIVRELRVKGDNAPRREADLRDFDLKEEVVEFYNDMTSRQNATVERLEIKHGVPFRWSVEVTLAA